MRKPYIFWDFDGTLLNTDDIIVDSWNATALKFLGHEFEKSEILKTFGETVRYTSKKLFPETSVDEAINYYREFQEKHYKGKIGLFDGCEGILDKLRELGYSNNIVTSRLCKTTMQCLKDLTITDKFDEVVTGDDVETPKPDPEPLKSAISQLEEKQGKKIELSECIMIGDSKFDVGCANNTGVTSVIVDWGKGIPEESIAEMGFSYDYVIRKPEEILEIV